MREIKFRAWDKGDRCFCSQSWINGNWYFANADESIALLQYTGLKDKNGVEIYEGDIGKNEKGTLFKVIYLEKNASFELVTINENRFHYKVHWIDNLEVIGNIYENPELLNERG